MSDSSDAYNEIRQQKLPPVVVNAASGLRGALEAYKEQMTDEQRAFVLNWVFEDWCKLCGSVYQLWYGSKLVGSMFSTQREAKEHATTARIPK